MDRLFWVYYVMLIALAILHLIFVYFRGKWFNAMRDKCPSLWQYLGMPQGGFSKAQINVRSDDAIYRSCADQQVRLYEKRMKIARALFFFVFSLGIVFSAYILLVRHGIVGLSGLTGG